jgi:hypothetical protein
MYVSVRFCGQSPYVATFREAPTDLDRSHCSRENGLPTQSIAHRLTDPWVRTQLLSQTIQWSRGVSQAPDDDQLLGLPGPYHRHAISTFNTCSCGPTKRFLTDTGGGYNLKGASLPHTHSLTFPTSCLPFPLVARTVSILTEFHYLNYNFEFFWESMAATWSFDHSTIYCSLHLCLAMLTTYL